MQYRFLIYISYSYAVPIGRPLEKELQKRGYAVHWFCDEKDTRIALPSTSLRFDSIEEVIDYDPDIILTITDVVPDFLRGLKVQVFHGFNAEKRSFRKDHFRIRGLFDLYCTQGPSTTSVFKEQQKKHPHFEVIETGWSKVDPLFPISEKKINETPTVFIASTFTERLSLAMNQKVFESFQSLLATKKYVFDMVLHPKLPSYIKEKWGGLTSSYFTYHNTTDLVPLMKKASIMFSDTTSAIQEFGLQEKPIVTFNHHIPKPHLINITSVSEIENALDTALTFPPAILEKMATFNQQLHPYKDGASSARVIDACISFLHADKSHLKSKPLNLVRKYQIRKKLGYFTLRSYNTAFTKT